MTDDELLDHVRDLREEGLSPKAIAHSLGVSPAQVTPLVRRVAQERSAPAADRRGALVGCWVSPAWSCGLSVDGHPEWPGQGDGRPKRGGLVGVLIARQK